MSMRSPNEYFCYAIDKTEETLAQFIFQKVFRQDFEEPGFAVLDFQEQITTVQLRAIMINLKKLLSQRLAQEIGKKLNYQWIGSFDQQENTKFHRDNAADQSFLMLGYEPTEIESQLFFADYSKFAYGQNLSNEVYFSDYNPMFNRGEKELAPYITEIKNFPKLNFKIVLINNSSINSCHSQGVLHKALVPKKEINKSRVINSIMLKTVDLKEFDDLAEKEAQELLKAN